MADTFLLALMFGLGTVLQAVLMLRGKNVNMAHFLGMVLVLLLVCIVFVKAGGNIGTFFFMCIIIFTAVYKEKILPVINEQVLLSFTILFWFIFLVYDHKLIDDTIACLPLFSSMLLVTLGTLVMAFTKIRIGFRLRAIFYIWFMLTAFVIGASQFWFGNLSIITNSEVSASADPFSAFTAGMVFLYIFTYFMYLLEVIPFPGKYQTIKERITQWQEHIALLSNKYSDYQMKTGHALLIIILQGGALILNYFLQLVPNYLLINISVLLVTYFVTSRHSDF